MTSHLPMALQHPDAALLEKPDGFSIHLDLAHQHLKLNDPRTHHPNDQSQQIWMRAFFFWELGDF